MNYDIQFHFREATLSDIPQIQRVRNAVQENRLSDPSLVTDEDCARYLFERGKGWVCEYEGDILGFSIADLAENNIWALFVHPDAAGKGVGKQLHRLMLDWYFSQGKSFVWLGTAPRTRAERFYRLNGWKETGSHGKGEIKFEMTISDWKQFSGQTADTALDRLLSPAQLNGITLPNRIIKAATFEGMLNTHCSISQACIDLHEEMAAGGVGMTTLAYCAPEADGRMQPHYMYIREDIRPDLERLAAAVHRHGSKLSGQLAHCGGFSRNTALQRKRPVGPSKNLNLPGLAYGMFFTQKMDEALMQEVEDGFARAAGIMKSCGFDAVEIHFGHGYLLSQFISPLTNKRKDEYGGTIENRMRFPLRVLTAVRKEVGPDFPILGKITLYDDKKGGISLQDGIAVAELLDKGGIDGIIPSAGTSSQNPMLLFHGDSLLKGLVKHEPNFLLRLGMRLMGKSMFRNYPYRELYLLEASRQLRDRVQCKLIYIGGATEPDSLKKAMDAGFDFIQSGRPLLRDPMMVRHLREEREQYVNGCTHCNICATLMDAPGGIKCILPEWQKEMIQSSGTS